MISVSNLRFERYCWLGNNHLNVSHDDTKPLFFYSVGGSKNHKGGVFEGVLTKSSRETPKILRSLLKLRPKLLMLIISFFAQLFHFHNIVNEEIFSPCSGTVFCE